MRLTSAEPNCVISFSLSTTTPGEPGVKAGAALLGTSTVDWERMLSTGSGVGSGGAAMTGLAESLLSEHAMSMSTQITAQNGLMIFSMNESLFQYSGSRRGA